MRKKAHGLKYIDIMCVYFTYIQEWNEIHKMGIMITLEKKKRKYDQRTQ